MKHKYNIFLISIILVGLCLRLFGLNWDFGFHLHPDERAIVLYTLPLQFPQTLQQFLSLESPWNPHFFAYGSFPIYLLKIVGSFSAAINTFYNSYDGITLIGRIISACFDSATIFIIYGIGYKIFNKSVGILAAFFYAVCVLPIQLSHFYAVDTILTFFITLLLFQLLRFYEKPRKKIAISIGIFFGFALATKISSLVIVLSIFLTLCLVIFVSQSINKKQNIRMYLFSFFTQLFLYGSLITVFSITTFSILEPYAFIDFTSFYTQSLTQAQMTKSAFTFPYTLQYVGKIPYIYEIKNSMLWGMGGILGLTSWVGVIIFFLQFLQTKIENIHKKIIISSFFLVYFGIVGDFAIGFMRYMLPLYPLLCLFSGWVIYDIFLFTRKKSSSLAIAIIGFFIFLSTLWVFSFLTIYTKPPTRVSATEWIQQHIPPGKTLAIEHWDDGLPLTGQQQYHINTLELYNAESTEKWQKIQQQLAETDYIILASNRLYTPLQKLTNCSILPKLYCYPQTAQYYKRLFNGSLGFKKVAVFSVYPTIPFFDIPINDETADESFTVYDHPKVIIFQKEKI